MAMPDFYTNAEKSRKTQEKYVQTVKALEEQEALWLEMQTAI